MYNIRVLQNMYFAELVTYESTHFASGIFNNIINIEVPWLLVLQGWLFCQKSCWRKKKVRIFKRYLSVWKLINITYRQFFFPITLGCKDFDILCTGWLQVSRQLYVTVKISFYVVFFFSWANSINQLNLFSNLKIFDWNTCKFSYCNNLNVATVCNYKSQKVHPRFEIQHSKYEFRESEFDI